VNPDGAALVLDALREPDRLASLDVRAWDRLLPAARNAGVLARLAALAADRGLDARLPEDVLDHLRAVRTLAAHHARSVRWEVHRIRHALRATGSPIVLLKGAAYVLAELPAGRGRLVSDVDVLVPRERLDAVERALLDAGWEPIKLEPYDQRYYRTWMHELPPLRHRERRTVVDVHHNILPESGRLRPDARAILRSARRIDEPELYVPAPADLVLHCAAHLFEDDLAGGLRDLADLDALLRQLGSDRELWRELVPRARALDLTRPLFYGLRLAARLLGTPIPAAVLEAAAIGRPPLPVVATMDALASRALTSDGRPSIGATDEAARWLLYARAHWNRMPPWLLVRHLGRKAARRWSER